MQNLGGRDAEIAQNTWESSQSSVFAKLIIFGANYQPPNQPQVQLPQDPSGCATTLYKQCKIQEVEMQKFPKMPGK